MKLTDEQRIKSIREILKRLHDPKTGFYESLANTESKKRAI